MHCQARQLVGGQAAAPDGRYRWQTVGPRKRDAELLRDEINRRVALGALYPSSPQTFGQFVDAWLERYSQRVRPATLASCRDSLRHLSVSELFALRDRAIDLERGIVLVEAGARERQLIPTKTNAGRRQVRLSAEALRILRAQLLAHMPNELGLVFPAPGGSIWRKDNFMARIFRPAVRRVRLAPLRFHDLRHTYAALMVAAGAHPKLLQAQLGHSSINVTLNTYGHLFPDAFADIGPSLDRLVETARREAYGADVGLGR